MEEEKNSKLFFLKSSAWTYSCIVLIDIFLEGYQYSNFLYVIITGIILSFIAAQIFYFIFGYQLNKKFQIDNIAINIEKIHDLRREVRKFQILIIAITSIILISSLKQQ